jgi:hypothetical protein
MAKILVLGRSSIATQLLINTLVCAGHTVDWIEERRSDRKEFLYRRVKKYGYVKVLGQLLFMLLRVILDLTSRKRKNAILADFGAFEQTLPILTTNNVNSLDFRSLATNSDIELVILSGTRILSATLLSHIPVKVINIHAGINPKYRGVHGGYWSLVNGEHYNFGSTIHFVDLGIDTGEVIAYAKTTISSDDNFVTYPLLQSVAALKILPEILENIFAKKLHPINVYMESKIWTHPTVWEYCHNRFFRRVK